MHVGEKQSELIIDTCGEQGSLALFREGKLLAEAVLQERTASATLLQAMRTLLADAGLSPAELGALGVVNGPGSFTGVRIGMAISKGLCEALQIPIGAASRLAVLMEAAQLQQGLAILHAGRDQVYVREQTQAEATEAMISVSELQEISAGKDVAYTEEKLRPLMAESARPHHVVLRAADAYGLVMRELLAGGSELLYLDANYVRNEAAIYKRAASGDAPRG